MDHESTVLSSSSGREIGMAVDLSNESADAIRWAIHHYLRRGDNVTLVHLESTEMDANITTDDAEKFTSEMHDPRVLGRCL